MQAATINATIFFKHSAEEVADVSAAIIPLADHIKSVATPQARKSMRHILNCKYFRAREAKDMRDMLLRAAKHAKAHLGNYFPLMHADILLSAKLLEDATKRYWTNFEYAINDVSPSR